MKRDEHTAGLGGTTGKPMPAPAPLPDQAPSTGTLKRRAMFLGSVNAADYAAQFLLSVVLARCLDEAAFGHYRLLWLVVGTVMAFAPLAMPASLYYYWPRADAGQRRLYVKQTLAFLVAAGALSAWAVGPWNPWLPDSARGIAHHAILVPAFVLLWVVASLLDVLPTTDERVAWQARATLGLAVVRTVVLAAAALLTRELLPVLLALLGFVVLKVGLLLGYVARYHGLGGPLLRRDTFAGQLRYAAPFGASGALYSLRVQADQWVVAAMFSVATFASFSIAAVFGPLLQVFRQSVNNIFLPSMSRRLALGDTAGMLELNSRANVMVATLVCPLFALIFVFAQDVVAVVYTSTYLAAAPVIRVYLLGFAALVVELATVTLLLQQGQFVMRLNLVALALCVLLSAWGALQFGAIGAAWGSVVTLWIDRVVTLRRIARMTGMPLARLQDWPALGRQLLFSVLAGACVWGIVDQGLGWREPLARVSLGAVLLVLACAGLQLPQLRRAWSEPGGAAAAPPAGGGMERLLFCTSSLAWGGAERHTITLMNRLVERGHACQAVYVKGEASQREHIRSHERSAVACLQATRYLDWRAMVAFGALVRRFRPTVIVAANPYALLYGLVARHLARLPVPLVVTFHSTRLLGLKERLQMLAYRPLFWAAACTVFVCRRQQRYWLRRGVCSRRNEVIYNGVDLAAFRSEEGPEVRKQVRGAFGLRESDYVIGITAGLRPEKNHLQLVEAVARLRQRGLPARALLIGDGEMREAITAHARRLGVASDVIITGFQADVRPFVQACDTMVLCSLTEALSLAVIEAMALRRPVVHSDVGGAAELVVPGRNGFLFPARDTEALIDRLALLHDREAARRMGDAARATVEAQFSEAAMVVRYERLLAEVSRHGS